MTRPVDRRHAGGHGLAGYGAAACLSRGGIRGRGYGLYARPVKARGLGIFLGHSWAAVKLVFYVVPEKVRGLGTFPRRVRATVEV